jgi:isoleucyl-tRNA synthetase
MLNAESELESKIDFSRAGDEWEATSKMDGSLVVVIDCTQDEATLSSGMSRELMNGIQQLRKAAGLELKDVVEVFFTEHGDVDVVERVVARNVSLFSAKFKGSVPLPSRFAPKWAVSLKCDAIEVGGSRVDVTICRPAVAVKDDLGEGPVNVLSTLEPFTLGNGQAFECTIDGERLSLKEGVDFWRSSAAKVRSMNLVDWLS